ncbi:helix-turn-helix domain-containing protein [Herbaspirillum sp. YR522]|uniref:helix-turn-helix domain-containing protein n=1 Tax=Herbaspirillum sp. YR522 TaxID=1144342 RepID=UPI00350F3E72
MSQDRAHATEFEITQETLASVLGVRRVGITDAAIRMRKNGIIEYSRGHVRILNRQRLEGQACSCYEGETRIYAQAL